MNDAKLNKNCDCPLECNAVSYSYYYVSSPFNMEEICPNKKFKTDFLMKPYYENLIPSQFTRNIKRFYFNETSDIGEICKIQSQYRAHVIFQLATNTMSVTVTSRRLSFFDKLSGFGELCT